MKFLRRSAHRASIVTLIAWLSACTSAHSQDRPEDQSELAQEQPATEATEQEVSTISVESSSPSTDGGQSGSESTDDEIAIQRDIRDATERLAEDTHDLAKYTAALAIVGGIVGLLTIFVLVFQAFYTGRAAKGAIKSAKATKRTLLLTQRADIQLKESFWSPTLTDLNDLPHSTFNFTFRNFGPTSARGAIFDFALGIPGEPVTDHFGPTPSVDVAPGQDFVFGFPTMRVIMNPHDLAAVAHGRRPMRYWGTIEYRDVFGDRHLTTMEATYIAGTAAFKIDRNDTTIERRRNGQRPK